MKIRDTKTKSINWSEVEAKHACGVISGEQDHNVRIFQTRNFEFDNRKAEALCLTTSLTTPTDPLQYIRTLIERGHIDQAAEILVTLKQSDAEIALDAEYLIECCRVKAFLGQWEAVISDCTKVFCLETSPVTRMTVLQTRATALYETGQWQLALKDIDLIRSFAKLFPESYSYFYAEILAIKIESTFGDIQKATRLLQHIWQTHLASSSMNQDQLLTLLRAEGHVLRARGQNSLWASHAVMILSNLIGDDQYAAFARLELFFAGVNTISLQKQLAQDRQAIPLVNLLLLERELGVSTFTTSKLLAMTRLSAETLQEFLPALECQDPLVLVIPKYRTVVKLEPFQIVVTPKKSRPYQTLLTILDGSTLSKQELFEKVFAQKYVSHLHDSTIYQLIRRIRQQFKVPLQIADASISATNTLVVKL
jgi:hypothetical protein